MLGLNALGALLKTNTKSAKRKGTGLRARLAVEELEDRRLLSTVSFKHAASLAGEGVGTANLAVVLSAAAASPVSVDYAVTGGTATAGSDYALAAGTLTFNPGQTRLLIPISIVNDALDEDNETIEVTLSNPGNATLGSVTEHTFTIVDNDPMPIVAFDTAA